jgi:hypothetical protein
MFIKFKVDLVYLGKQNLKFREGKFLKLKEDSCSILREVRTFVWGRKVSQAQRRFMYLLGEARS